MLLEKWRVCPASQDAVKANAVEINGSTDYIAVIDDTIFFNDKTVDLDVPVNTADVVKSAAVDTNEARQWLAVAENNVFVSPGTRQLGF